jgi:protein-tyrosine-phosphatase
MKQSPIPAVFVPSEDWELPDPHGNEIEEIGPIRDEIKRRVGLLINRLMPENAKSLAKNKE